MCNKTLVIERVNECYEIVSKYYNRNFIVPTILFTKKGVVAGTASLYGNELNFNLVLLNENLEHFINQTVGHEVAHLIVFQLNPPVRKYNIDGTRKRVSIHGKAWKKVMSVLGLEAMRCHNYDVTNVVAKGTMFKYVCPVCDTVLQMGKTRHKRMQDKSYVYFHCDTTVPLVNIK